MNYAIVVDTSVARAASPSSGSMEARYCWMSLDGISRGRFRLAMSDPLYDEWLRVAVDRPQGDWRCYVSRHAMLWLKEMTSRHRVFWVKPHEEPGFRDAVLAAVEESRANKTRKDLHLVETALAADRRVISCDREIRRILGNAATRVDTLRPILWVHPVDHDAPQWLAEGARDVPHLRLAGQAEEDL